MADISNKLIEPREDGTYETRPHVPITPKATTTFGIAEANKKQRDIQRAEIRARTIKS